MAIPRAALLAMVGVVLIVGVFAASQLAKKQEESGSLPDAPAATLPQSAEARKPAEKPSSSARAEGGPPSANAERPPSAPSAKPEARSPAGAPASVTRAIANGDVVVIYLSQGAADDDATDAAARAVKDLRGVTVVTDSIDNVSDYRRVLAGLGVSQAPAVVIVDSDGQGRLVEGYTDPESLRQQVADARK